MRCSGISYRAESSKEWDLLSVGFRGIFVAVTSILPANADLLRPVFLLCGVPYRARLIQPVIAVRGPGSNLTSKFLFLPL